MKNLETAIYDRLHNDASLSVLAGHGIWNGIRNTEDFVEGQRKGWVTFYIYTGGDTHWAAGRFRDVQIYVRGHAHVSEGAGLAVQIDDRCGELLHDWRPTITGWSNAWRIVRRYTVQSAYRLKGRVQYYTSGAMYRVRYGND